MEAYKRQNLVNMTPRSRNSQEYLALIILDTIEQDSLIIRHRAVFVDQIRFGSPRPPSIFGLQMESQEPFFLHESQEPCVWAFSACFFGHLAAKGTNGQCDFFYRSSQLKICYQPYRSNIDRNGSKYSKCKPASMIESIRLCTRKASICIFDK